MCLISRKLKALDIREKRLAMRKKVQSETNSPIFMKRQSYQNLDFVPELLFQNISNTDQSQNDPESIFLNRSYPHSNNFEQFYEKYTLLDKIGEGGHSSVYKCQEKLTGKFFAVKITRFRDEEMIINSKTQFKFNKLLSNSSIIQLKELILDDNKMITYNVQEYCYNKNLKEELLNRAQRKFSQLQTANVIKRALQALNYMHSKNVCHRDIKPENILYNSQNGEIKLIDLQCSKNKKETQNFQMWTKTGTINYQAPQYFLSGTYSQKVDVWAVGVLLYELLTGKLPFYSSYYKKTVQLITTTDIDVEQLVICDDLKSLLKQLLKKESNQRINIQQALKKCKSAINSLR